MKDFDGDRTDPIWKGAMEMRFRLATILRFGGENYLNGFILAMAERLAKLDEDLADESLETQEAEELAELEVRMKL